MEYFYVYILKCSDQSYYVGHTDNIDFRLAQHKSGETKYTSLRLPVELVFLEGFSTRDEAFAMERRIKGWRRDKKEALIAKDWDRLQKLSKKLFEQT